MKKLLTVALVFGICGVVGLHEARAQIEIGPRIGFDLIGDVEEFFIGADGRLSLVALPVVLNATFDLYLAEENHDFSQLSFNALYAFGIVNVAFSPYVGGGIGFSRTSGDTDVGLNLIGGATFGFGNLKPFAQAQITFGDVDLFTIGGGLLFSIGG